MNRRFARPWWAVLAGVSGVSVLIQFALVFLAPTPDVSLVMSVVRFFSYFTIQSNLLVLAATVPLIRDPAYDGARWRVIRLDALLGITITGIVFAVMLADTYRPVGLAWWANLGMHYVTPVMALLGWLLFGPWDRMGGAVIPKALIWVVLWIAWTLAMGAVTDFYPYFFLDVRTLGYGAALRNIGIINGMGLAFLLAFYGVDRWRASSASRTGSAA